MKDADGQGRIQINGQTLGKFSAAGERNIYSAKLGDGISIQNFNLGKAQGGSGYLGIQLDGKQKVALIQGTPAVLRNASKTIAACAFKTSAMVHFCSINIPANEGRFRRAA